MDVMGRWTRCDTVGCDAAGVGVETLNLETCSLEEVNESISKSSGFVIGSPTLGGHMPTQVTHPILPCTRSGVVGKAGVMEAQLNLY